ncbi:MAG TPA: hypothetical protein VKR53_13925 [Puia sp.]|nr:hypothetical protein [Puia sp.]
MSVIIFSIILGAIVYYLCTIIPSWFRRGYNTNSVSIQAQEKRRESKLINTPARKKEEEKGYDFEKFIVSRFQPEYFNILQWRSDKFVDGRYPLSNLGPDLVFEYRSRSRTVRFAVECKWRSRFNNGFIKWAKDHQPRNYQDFQHKENIPVFVMLGVGNQPSLPAELYIIPLQDIPLNRTVLHFDFLKHYKRYHVDKRFFLNSERMTID